MCLEIKLERAVYIRNDDITNRKNIQAPGTHLVYPERQGFRDIKLKLKNTIKKLKRLSFLEILNETNAIVRGYANYFA